MRFYDGAHNFMWDEEYAIQPGGYLDEDSYKAGGLPSFRMTVNRIFEGVALFGPALFARYPTVSVQPIMPPQITPEALGLDMRDPQAAMMYQQYMEEQQREMSVKHSCSNIKAHYLDWVQRETDKKTECRKALTEAIVKGMGCLYHDLYTPSGSQLRMPRSVYLNVDDYFKDPDATCAENVEWIAIRRIEAVNRVEAKFGLPSGTIRGQWQSMGSQATELGQRDVKQNRYDGKSFDLVEYYEVFSKNGIGDKLSNERWADLPDLSDFGDFCYLAICKDVPFPLNIPSDLIHTAEFEELFLRAQWPIPFWTDEGLGGGWPVSEIGFFHKPGCVWPIPLFKPVIGEMRFINWCMSFLADRVAASSTTYLGVAQAAGAEIKEKILGGMAPFTVVEIADILGKNVSDVMSFMNSPPVNTDIWRMVIEVSERIDKATGLTELMYGMSSRQIRSAREADIKDANTSIRPDDMAEMTENWLSQTVLKEMEAAAWGCGEEDVSPVLGPAGARVFVNMLDTQGFEKIVRGYSYTIEAGSSRKPNKANRLRDLNSFGQIALPVLQQFALQGLTDPWNNFMAEYGKALDMDASSFMIQLPPPQPPSQEDQIRQQLELQRVAAEVEGEQIDNAQKQAEIQTSLVDTIINSQATVADIELKKAQREQLDNGTNLS